LEQKKEVWEIIELMKMTADWLGKNVMGKFTVKLPLFSVIIMYIFCPVLSDSRADETTDGDSVPLLDPSAKRYIEAKRIDQGLNIDGALCDSAWKNIIFQENFMQRDPNEGAPVSERTSVGILYDEKNLYVGVKCYDSEPGKIIAREMRRDARVDDDDYFELILDTYHDSRNGFYFITNPNGSKRDAVLGNEGRNYNSSWDGIWHCKTVVNECGWFAEIAIPWKTLRFAEGDTDVWGINLARMIRRKNEHSFWQLIPRDYGWGGLFRVSEAGKLRGLHDLKMGGNLEFKPYFTGGVQRDLKTEFTNHTVSDIGLNTKVALTANLALDVTLNPDFAQVESDREQVNLT